MKRGLFFVFVIATLAFASKDDFFISTEVNIEPESSLFVKGTTNVNTFKCIYNVTKFKNPIPVNYHLENGKMVFNKTVLVLNNNCFDCGGKAINNDFQDILKSHQYPQINLVLKEIKSLEESTNVEVFVDIEIAGVKRPYVIPVNLNEQDNMFINGHVDICLTDFHITAPKKFFGLISVDNEIEIEFKLVVQEEES
ncbi:YceI family protein [Flavobacteriaceae bacterium SZ-1-7]|uniref:YceI family protein n=1 Tax=Tamlana sedimenti TaxID=3134126 RepID=UPI00312532F8